MNAPIQEAGIASKPRAGNAPIQGAGIASKPRAGNAPIQEPAMPRSKGPASPRNQEPAMPRSQPVIAALAALPMQKTESRRNLHFSLRLSAIPCLLTCFSDHKYFRLTVTMPVAVIPLISSSASHRMELLVSPVLGPFVFPVLSEVEAAAAFFSHTAV